MGEGYFYGSLDDIVAEYPAPALVMGGHRDNILSFNVQAFTGPLVSLHAIEICGEISNM